MLCGIFFIIFKSLNCLCNVSCCIIKVRNIQSYIKVRESRIVIKALHRIAKASDHFQRFINSVPLGEHRSQFNRKVWKRCRDIVSIPCPCLHHVFPEIVFKFQKVQILHISRIFRLKLIHHRP